MKAAVWYGKHDIRVENKEEPIIKPGKVKIKVAWTGICGSDLHAYHGAEGVVQVGEPHPVTGEMAPLTLGHEFSGVIHEIGEGVSGLSVGDRVAIEPAIKCGKCENCVRGNYNLCEHNGFVGLQSDGAFAEYAIVDPHMVHKLPDNISFEEATAIEPTAVSFHALKLSNMKAGDTVAVFGVGPIGLTAILCAKAAGASRIYAIDVSNERLEMAQKLGATTVINAIEENAAEKIYAETGSGVTIAFDCAGAEATVNSAIDSLAKGGQLVIVSIIPEPIKVNLLQANLKEINILATIGYRDVYKDVIAMVESGQLDLKPIITKKIGLDDIIEEGFHALTNDKSQAKILVSPTGV
ncbi:alcohol dehydrogenase [Oceanobacillus iheyensis HTE831]|uniref:Alcohol dehydrogenase n=1 Tax=Oceanobacillus iheyensis (strain DSM 14371 / CIP 107618 / JCM 11309 / KCTC 3954 / HTE831) TaxID=221109 RepID=Q8EL78_OCEIH|nr:2,3-butanediol dehydrogenase [Oceanobacillus iheyensis]BAC15309.1 alcohol dehydrogenase [Oceanobacillus iheyensis HTE831]